MIDLHRASLVQASFRLSRAFGWTPPQIQELTMGQIMLYLQLLDEEAQHDGQP